MEKDYPLLNWKQSTSLKHSGQKEAGIICEQERLPKRLQTRRQTTIWYIKNMLFKKSIAYHTITGFGMSGILIEISKLFYNSKFEYDVYKM